MNKIIKLLLVKIQNFETLLLSPQRLTLYDHHHYHHHNRHCYSYHHCYLYTPTTTPYYCHNHPTPPNNCRCHHHHYYHHCCCCHHPHNYAYVCHYINSIIFFIELTSSRYLVFNSRIFVFMIETVHIIKYFVKIISKKN